MKTAVQIAVEKLEQFIPAGNQLSIRIILDEALEKEKYQIIYAYSEGYSDGVQEPNPNDNYYNERYQNK